MDSLALIIPFLPKKEQVQLIVEGAKLHLARLRFDEISEVLLTGREDGKGRFIDGVG